MSGNRCLKYYLCVVLFSSILVACSKMNDTHKQFVEGGEIYYPGRADSLKVYPGRNRIKLSWMLISDPKITRTVVYWNNKADSVVIPVTRTSGIDTVSTMLNSIPEGTYTFEVYTYDAQGHRSVKVDTIARVYGDNYNITLVNRAIRSAVMNTKADTAIVEWYGASSQHIGVDLRYKNSLNDSIFMFIPADSIRVRLPKFTKGQAFRYRSLYKPEKNAIDTFFTIYESRIVN